MKKKQAHVIISGFVQGVCFRYETRWQAQILRIDGWVKNRPDGKVEALFEGEKDAVDSMVQWCRQGPAGAVVNQVDVEEDKFTGKFSCFDIRFY